MTHWLGWSVVIGGCRSGKSTVAADLAKVCGIPWIYGYDQKHEDEIGTKFIGKGMYVSMTEVLGEVSAGKRWEGDISGGFLWVDEAVRDPIKLLDLATRFERVVWVSHPSEEIRESLFYRICQKLGTVSHLPIRPEFIDAVLESCGSKDEFRTRALGLFPVPVSRSAATGARTAREAGVS